MDYGVLDRWIGGLAVIISGDSYAVVGRIISSGRLRVVYV